MGTKKFTIKTSQEEDGSISAEVVELPGCFTSGTTMEELQKYIKKAIQWYLEGMQKR